MSVAVAQAMRYAGCPNRRSLGVSDVSPLHDVMCCCALHWCLPSNGDPAVVQLDLSTPDPTALRCDVLHCAALRACRPPHPIAPEPLRRRRFHSSNPHPKEGWRLLALARPSRSCWVGATAYAATPLAAAMRARSLDAVEAP